jgi:hypothetical protein
MTAHNILKKAAILLILTLAFSSKVSAQSEDSLRSYASQLTTIVGRWLANPDTSRDSVITAFLHINPTTTIKIKDQLTGFTLTYSTPEINWYTEDIRILDHDSTGYLIKAKIPAKIYNLHKMLTCYAVWWGRGTTVVKYGGINMRIKLTLQSQPQKASVYLIPHRIWMSKFERTTWQKNMNLLNDYLVDTDQTNTAVNIDETVYTVVFKLGEKFQVRTHYTKPMETEPAQKVTVAFQNE